jgi:hypothetical protein
VFPDSHSQSRHVSVEFARASIRFVGVDRKSREGARVSAMPPEAELAIVRIADAGIGTRNREDLERRTD